MCRLFDRGKRPHDLNPNLAVRRHALGSEDCKKFLPHAGLGLVGAHFDDHESPVTVWRGHSCPALSACIAALSVNRSNFITFVSSYLGAPALPRSNKRLLNRRLAKLAGVSPNFTSA